MTVFIQAASAKSGGAETYLRNVVERLARLGKEHHYLIQVSPEVAAAIGQRQNVTIQETRAGHWPGWKRFLWDQVAARRMIRREKVDVLIASSDFGMLFPPCPQILLLRNSIYFSDLYRRAVLPLKSLSFRLGFRLRRRLILLSVRSACKVMTASKSMLDQARRFIPIPDGKAVVNPFGVSTDRFAGRPSPSPPGRLRLLYVTEYGDYKNLSVLLKALSRLKAQGMNDVLLTCTADPAQFPETESCSRALDEFLSGDPSIAPHLRYTGPVPFEKIPDLYRQSDLFVFPSLSESFAHPLAEAMAAGLPIVASDIPICREMCGEAAVYFSPLDPDDLAQKILLFRNDRLLCARLGEEGRKRAETRFEWDRHVRSLLDAIRDAALKTR